MSDAIGSKDWTAIHDHMPGADQTLRVRGTVTYPTEGYEAKLVPSVPQGFNPAILEMDVQERAPTGAPDVVTDVPVEYEDDNAAEYDQVHIRGLEVVIDVQHPQ